ncbi:uncharacterized protein LOC107304960 [Oryza brachyantha]|uniref:Uncharacterized protein n=1 Tax=Oryza brachyantha TaxID=4533 RepID=J3MZN3_ORYBR|nr:uncharacterized protein LOC107304960 [Oryza brachyantha]
MASCAAPQLACGLFGGVFTAAELAAADQLVQLSCSSGGDEADASPSFSSTPSSPRSVNTCAATAAADEEFEGRLRAGETMELDMRARKRYRLLSELYAATATKRGTASCRKRKRDGSPEAEAEIAMR